MHGRSGPRRPEGSEPAARVTDQGIQDAKASQDRNTLLIFLPGSPGMMVGWNRSSSSRAIAPGSSTPSACGSGASSGAPMSAAIRRPQNGGRTSVSTSIPTRSPSWSCSTRRGAVCCDRGATPMTVRSAVGGQPLSCRSTKSEPPPPELGVWAATARRRLVAALPETGRGPLRSENSRSHRAPIPSGNDAMSGRPEKVVILGQGYVGLSLAVRAVEVGFDVTGIEIDPVRLGRLQRSESYIEDITDKQLVACRDTGRYVASSHNEDCAGFDIAVVTVPTPLSDGFPDLSFIEESARV